MRTVIGLPPTSFFVDQLMNSKGSGNRDFDDFVKRQQPTAAETKPIDWARQRDEWLQHLRKLYDQIESFLAGYIESGEIRRDLRAITPHEENIRSHKAHQMILHISRQ